MCGVRSSLNNLKVSLKLFKLPALSVRIFPDLFRDLVRIVSFPLRVRNLCLDLYELWTLFPVSAAQSPQHARDANLALKGLLGPLHALLLLHHRRASPCLFCARSLQLIAVLPLLLAEVR